MTLADYDTSVEKIAALKAAALDPALININKTNFTSNGISYIIVSDNFNVNGILINKYESYSLDCYQVENNDIVTEERDIMFYIKDSDIVYSDPVTTYQNRLAAIYTTGLTRIAPSDSFTTGPHGSIIRHLRLTQISGEVIEVMDNNLNLPVPSGILVATQASPGSCSYFDVPPDW